MLLVVATLLLSALRPPVVNRQENVACCLGSTPILADRSSVFDDYPGVLRVESPGQVLFVRVRPTVKETVREQFRAPREPERATLWNSSLRRSVSPHDQVPKPCTLPFPIVGPPHPTVEVLGLRSVTGLTSRNPEKLQSVALICDIQQGAAGSEFAEQLLVVTQSRAHLAHGVPFSILAAKPGSTRNSQYCRPFLVERRTLNGFHIDELAELLGKCGVHAATRRLSVFEPARPLARSARSLSCH